MTPVSSVQPVIPWMFVAGGRLVVCSPSQHRQPRRIAFKPANGFEPMTFALQKRCSTTELSRRRTPAYRSVGSGVMAAATVDPSAKGLVRAEC